MRSASTRARFGTIVPWVLGALLIICAAATAWIGVRGAIAFSSLQTARTFIVAAAESTDEADESAAHLREAGDAMMLASEMTSDPVWHAAAHLPWIGPQLQAVTGATAAGNDVAQSALEPMARLASSISLSSLRPVNGVLDLAALDAARSAANDAAAGLGTARYRLETIDRRSLLRPIREGVDVLTQETATASRAVEAAQLLPAMLGADHPRTWLLLFQNNAELRSLGGMPGATAVITADRGHIALAGQGTGVIPRFVNPVVDLGADQLGIYGERPGVWFSGTTILPDFAEAAPIAREMWRRAHGVEADGVISLDPIALSYMLRATGPITLPTGETLTSENAVDFLLNGVYLDYPKPVDQNVVFASAAATVFTAFASGAADPAALVSSLAQAAGERRALLWSSVADEQALFDDAGLSGALPTSDGDIARFGVYLNDGTGSKLGYYLDADAHVEWKACSAGKDAAGDFATLTLTLKNTAPADAASTLPPSIVGGGHGVKAGTLRIVTYIYLPSGATLENANGTPSSAFGGGVDGDYRVLSHQVDLKPGDTSTIGLTARLASPSSTIAADLTPAFGLTTVSTKCGDD